MPGPIPNARFIELTVSARLRLVGLSRREAEATLLVAQGFLLREAADQLHVSLGTVKTLLSRSRAKLGCPTLRQLTIELVRSEIIRAGDLTRDAGEQQSPRLERPAKG